MQLVNSADRSLEVEQRCAALGAILTPLVDNGTVSLKQRQATLQQYNAELQAVDKRITLGL